jgi:PucR C-terminal helix-turn-helix domain
MPRFGTNWSKIARYRDVDSEHDSEALSQVRRCMGERGEFLRGRGTRRTASEGRGFESPHLRHRTSPDPDGFGLTCLCAWHSRCGRGLEAFRRSHEQARRVGRLAVLGPDEGPRALQYRDCDVTTLLAADPGHAHELVFAVLGPLADDEPAHRKLVDTVAIYHQEGMSVTRSAARLVVHPNTEAYRVRRVLDTSGETDSGSLRLRAVVALARNVGPTTE